MIQILFTLIFAEMALIVIFVFKTPLRKLVIMGLDRVKRGQAPLVVKAVGSTIFVVMMSSVYSVIRIHNRGNRDDGDGELTPTDQILAARHLLEASLMGFSLFLALMIDRLHHYIRELRIRRKNMDAIKKQNRIIENGKNGSQDEVKALEGELTTLKEKLSRLESELDEKTKDASNAEANAIALKKQSEGFLLEYDRLLEDNQNLRAQLQSLDRRLSHSGGKKVT
ncbi:B-cell receptor-associated protein 31 [Cynara cardunculus var. scolymus]|uniref:B-cell receptor-associated protein 31 n=1 Tax=Cynara cardunculus var. scolymus TaxID=59895 RepID=UPI000D627360|nr:B-cell receptor-associated protein 31 [Cynara cardunculus var. scolymus]